MNGYSPSRELRPLRLAGILIMRSGPYDRTSGLEVKAESIETHDFGKFICFGFISRLLLHRVRVRCGLSQNGRIGIQINCLLHKISRTHSSMPQDRARVSVRKAILRLHRDEGPQSARATRTRVRKHNTNSPIEVLNAKDKEFEYKGAVDVCSEFVPPSDTISTRRRVLRFRIVNKNDDLVGVQVMIERCEVSDMKV